MSTPYVTRSDIAVGLRGAGLAAGDVVIAHGSLSSMGHVVGGATAVVQAMLDVLTPAGTLVVPMHTPENGNPDEFGHPPLPRRARTLWPEHYPAFVAEQTPCRYMGAIPELLRGWSGALRSQHPLCSFGAVGAAADAITRDHPLDDALGDGSPLGRIYGLAGKILFLGVGHDKNTSFHLAEARARTSTSKIHQAAVRIGGQREWVSYRDWDWDNTQFEDIGAALETTSPPAESRIGRARVRVHRMRTAVDFAEAWMRARGAVLAGADWPSPTLEGGLRLRRPTIEDAPLLLTCTRLEAMMARLEATPHETIEDAEDFLCEALGGWANEECFTWVAESEAGGPPSGIVRARLHNPTVTMDFAFLARVERDAAAAALARCVAVMLSSSRATRVQAFCTPDHEDMAMLYAAGFRHEGILRRAHRRPDGSVVDRVVLAVTS